MVAKDDNGKPTRVPGLELETREDVRRFLEALKRKEMKAHYQEELNNIKTRLSVEKELYKLEDQRCKIGY